MNINHHQCGWILRVPLAVVLVLGLLAPALGAQERKGAEIAVAKNDGVVVKGELLAVKGTDLLIMDGPTPGGVSVSLADAKLVTVVKRGKAGVILAGALVGGGVGAAAGYGVESGQHGFLSSLPKAAGTLVGGGLGLVAGLLVGALVSSNKTIAVVGTDPISVGRVAAQLRPLARDRS